MTDESADDIKDILQRMLVLEGKVDSIKDEIKKNQIDMTEKLGEINSRLKLLEDFKGRSENRPRERFYYWSLIATWVSIGIAFVALIFK